MTNSESDDLAHVSVMERSRNRMFPDSSISPNRTPRKVVIVCQSGQTVSDAVKYGTFRATIEFARYLKQKGIPVILVGLAPTEQGFNEEIPYVGASNRRSLFRIVRKMAPIDTLVGISRSDILRMGGASRYVIFQHNPSFIQGKTSARLLNRFRVTVITASNYSKMEQNGYGVREELIKVVPNGCDTEAFSCHGPEQRQDHSLVFAGHMVPYKGLDVALRAFAIVRQHFPDATFSAYGRTLPWNTTKEHLLDPGMLDQRGFPVWHEIEDAVPGFHYCGEVTQDELASAFRRHSLLVIPSRIEETFGIVSLEAQACGCIPVSSAPGGLSGNLKRRRDWLFVRR